MGSIYREASIGKHLSGSFKWNPEFAETLIRQVVNGMVYKKKMSRNLIRMGVNNKAYKKIEEERVEKSYKTRQKRHSL